MALPGVFGSCTVFDDYVDSDGNPMAGTVEFTPHKIRYLVSGKGPTILPVARVGTLDATGHLEASLLLSVDSQITPNDTWRVVHKLIGAKAIAASPDPYELTLNESLDGLRVRLRTLVDDSAAVVSPLYGAGIYGEGLFAA